VKGGWIMPVVQVAFYTKVPKLERIDKEAKAEGLSRTAFVNKAIDFYLAAKEKNAPAGEGVKTT